MKAVLIIFFILIILFPSSVMGKTEDLQSGFTIEYPNKWLSETIGNKTTIYSPDNKAIVMCEDFYASNLDAVYGKIERKVSNIIDNVEFIITPKKSFFNTLQGVMSEGYGTVRDKKVKWLLSLVVCKENALLTIGYAKSDDYIYHKKIFNKIIHSVRETTEKSDNINNQ